MTSIFQINDEITVALRGVVKDFGALRAVDGVDLSIRRGEVFGLIGHNGAGKSTLFRMMLGLESITAGEILVGGTSVRGRDFRAVRRHIGYLPENTVLYDNLSGIETLRFFARLKQVALDECAPALERVGLTQAAARPVREYSKGMRQRLGFAQALLGTPRVLFLDEPSNGLDPVATRDFYTVLQDLREQGVTIIITSHILAELQERVDRLAIMANGKIQAMGTVAELRSQLDLPLSITLRVQVSALDALQARLIELPGVKLQALSGGLAISCPRSSKMQALALIATLGSQLLDLHIEESSLEDLFFGLRA